MLKFAAVSTFKESYFFCRKDIPSNIKAGKDLLEEQFYSTFARPKPKQFSNEAAFCGE